MKTSKFQRLVTALLVLCLCLGLAVPAMAAEPSVSDFGSFMENLKVLEGYADSYASIVGTDAKGLVINYIRTGVPKYTTGSWQTMAGPENTGFTNYVAAQDAANGTTAVALRNLKEFTTPNGQTVEFEHMFGAMDMGYYNAKNADLGSWAGDLSDLLFFSKEGGAGNHATMDAMIADVRANYLGIDQDGVSGFGRLDIYGDLDAYYLLSRINAGLTISAAMKGWYTEKLTDNDRAILFLNGRFDKLSTREDVRKAIFDTYDANLGVKMLDAENGITADDETLRVACCYAFADYLYELAEGCLEGDGTNPYYSVFSSTQSQIAPGVTQTVKYAYSSDNKQMAYYIAEVEVARDDVSIYANYNENDPSKGWAMSPVYDQMMAAQNRHTNPEDPEHYIENYNAVLGVNGDFFNMSTGKPTNALVMEGVTYNPANNSSNTFFGILKDGTPVIGYGHEFKNYADQLQEAVGGSAVLVADGKPTVSYTESHVNNRASRTCVGITRSGQVILMVLDGRQEPFSCGGSYQELAQIMIDAGCVTAINLDGGGSSTFIAKAEGSDELSLVNSPSDGYQRSVSSSLLVVSTAVTSNEFHHATVATDYDYLTVGTSMDLNAVGVSVSGNAAEVPENAQWQVSDNAIGSVSGNVFTASALGDVTVSLTVDGKTVGSKVLHVVVPDALNIPQNTISVVYGVPTKLPLEASYGGNPVAFNENDVLVVLEYSNAGTVNGLEFTLIEEAAYRTVMIGAALMSDFSVMAMTTLKAYRMDEAVFDFENATAGDLTFSWLREVLNTESREDNVFQILDTEEDMGISYTFGLNMEAIEIPEKLMDLTDMLSGGPNATAWDYLLQLAERVSVLTTVEITAQFDPNLDVDISELTFANEYFTLKEAKLDETTNTLTITCKWVDQDAAIDPVTANPICILSGLKATPKDDAAWDENDQLQIINSGVVNYDIYLRASQLYSFSIIENNQKLYDLYPFVNNDVIIGGSPEKGGHFAATYATFNDSIVLDSTNRQGWYTYNERVYYYQDNEPLTGTQRLPSQADPNTMGFYRFDDQGVFVGNFTGLIRLDGKLYYAVDGVGKTGWQTVTTAGQTNYYYFDPTTGAAVDGTQTIGGYTYTFTGNVLTRGQLVTDANGTRYRWAGQWLKDEWLNLDGKETYILRGGYFVTGLQKRFYTDGKVYYFAFGEDGWWMKDYTGFYDYEGSTYLIENGLVNEYPGMVKMGEDYYYFNSRGTMIKGRTYWVDKSNGYVQNGNYTFDETGKLVIENTPVDPDPPGQPDTPEVPDTEKLNGIVKASDEVWYYYVDGVKTYAGLIKIGDDFYYVDSKCQVKHDCTYWISKNNGYMKNQMYTFDSEGKLVLDAEPEVPDTPDTPAVPDPEKLNGIVKETADVWYYYVDGVKTYAGLVKIGDDFYYVNSKCQVMHDCTYWISKNNGYMKNQNYTFDSEGKLVLDTEPEVPDTPVTPGPDKLNGIVKETEDIWYYYVDGVKTYAGLIKIGDDFYYVDSKCQVKHDCTYYISKNNGYMSNGNYTFDSEGRMVLDTEPEIPETPVVPDTPEEPEKLNGIVKETEDVWYYYVDGVKTYAGLIKIGDDFYYVDSKCQVKHDCTYYISKNNGYMKNGSYTFDSEGRMVV